jgi:carboxypeptidase Taq
MNSTYNEKLKEFKEVITKIEYLKYTLNSLVYWDKLICMPNKGIGYRSKVMGYMADEMYNLLSSKKVGEYIKFFENNKENDIITNAMIEKIKTSSSFINKIPEKEYTKYIELVAESEGVWQKAVDENDFEIFKPNLEKLIVTYQQLAEYWGYEKEPYDAFLNYYEKDFSVEDIEKIIEPLKINIIKLLYSIVRSDKVKEIKEIKKIPNISLDKQMEITKMVFEEIGFDFDAGRVDLGNQPTILSNSPNDVRVVTSLFEDDFITGFYNSLFSGGRGLYEQNISVNLMGTLLAEVASFSLEESIGKIYENIIGKSKGFWEYMLPKIKKISPEFDEYEATDIYNLVNEINWTPIRLEADQLTYMLHIIIRYEIERDLINGSLKVDDIKSVWNSKYNELLGVEAKSDKEGVLQDIHWAGGYFGYFPTAFISNISASQFANVMESEIGNLENLVKSGRFDMINEWLKEKIYKHGSIYSCRDLITSITETGLDANAFNKLLNGRYMEVYDLK